MELAKFPSHGGFSVRSILTFALAVMTAALLWITLSSTPALAAPEAHWNGDAIISENRGYTAATDINDTSGTILSGSTIYKTPLQNNGTGDSASQKVFIIYFSPGVDPPTATSAQYVEFDYKNGVYSNPQNEQDVTLTLKSEQEAGSSCTVGGIGWMLCPITTFLADAMDSIFGILAGMIETKPPILGDTSNSMYVAWNVMRTIANIAFVIAFLIIIYSQLTSMGVSNYGLKKLIPRLIIAAILVNISFYVAALAIDISNILGYSVQNIFNTIREDVFHISNDGLGSSLTSGWAQVASATLAVGGVVGGVYYASTGALYLLIPLLLGLLTTIILVVVILAARQAIILILVIIAPLAFVANLLPNTEKWFDKWKDLFMTMLIFFPAFSLVFGGSQLAGQLIIQNANGNLVTVLFGLAVQVAPLVITPLLLKLSGGLLGRIAQITNNPKKGLVDRNRNWAQSRAEHAKQQNIARGPRLRNPASWGAGMVKRSDFSKRRLSDKTDVWKQAATNRYEESEKYGKIHEQKADVDLNKERIHNDHAAHIDHLKTRQGTALHDTAMRTQVSKDKLETQQQHLSGYYNTLRTVGGTDLNTSNNNLEAAKGNNEASEQTKAAYLNEQRTFRSTQLGAAAERLEAAKLNAEGMQNTYTAHIDNLKLTPENTISKAAVFAQSSKEHTEATQNRVQAMFDLERRTEGTKLNVSTLDVEKAKFSAEASKSFTTEYLNNTKATVGTDLHLEKIRAEQAKLATQVSETALNQVVEEYKTGKLERQGELGNLAASMVESVEYQAAHARGVQAAQNIQQGNIARSFTDVELDTNGNRTSIKTSRAQELLNIAKGVDEYGELRAEASAMATLNEISSKTRKLNEDLLEERAIESNLTPKDYAKKLVEDRLANGATAPDAVSEDVIKAAMEIMGREAQIPHIRKMRMSSDFNQEHLSAMLLRNSPTMKSKGGFDLQNDPSLANATEEKMLASMAANTGSTSPEDLPGLKLAAAYDFADNTDKMLWTATALASSSNADEQKAGAKGIVGLETAYANITTALLDPEVRRRMGDNLLPSIKMHMKLHRHFQKTENEIDYSAISPISLPGDYADNESPGDRYMA